MNRRALITIAVIVAAALTVVLVLTLDRPAAEPLPDPDPKIIIALDAGHGGRDPGAVVGDVVEKDINLHIIKHVRDLIDADPDLHTYLIRDVDVFIPLESRIERAEQANAEMYITVHANSFGDPKVHGLEVWVDDSLPDEAESWVLAAMIREGIVAQTGVRDRGTREQELYLRRTDMPAVSVEVGYMTHPDELTKLVDEAYHQMLAQGIVDGIKQFVGWKYREDATP